MSKEIFRSDNEGGLSESSDVLKQKGEETSPDSETPEINKDSSAEQEGAEQKGKKEEDIQKETREKAMEESRAYFQQRFDKLLVVLEENEEGIADLLERVKEGEDIKLEDIQTTFKLEGEVGMSEAIAKSIKECKPIVELVPAQELLKKLVKEKLEPSRQLYEAQLAFDSGGSWYHTSDVGNAALQRIKSEVVATHEQGTTT